MHRYDAIVLGAGAAGLFAAATAGQRGLRVLVVDHNDAPGRKILISGGGRCNFTNLGTAPDRFLSANPHFARSALARYTPADFIALVERHRIAWHEKTLGQLFCDGSARAIVAMLMDECAAGAVDFVFGAAVRDLAHADGAFRVSLDTRQVFAPQLVVATGGPAIPKLGATGFAYDIARKFGLKVVEPRPALVPLTLPGSEALFRDLAGVSAPVEAQAGGAAFREAALFTHRGLSGPVILQVSSYWRPGQPVVVDFLPDLGDDWLLKTVRDGSERAVTPSRTAQKPPRTLTLLARFLPERLAKSLILRLSLGDTLAGLGDQALLNAMKSLKNFAFHPNGTEGFAKAEVTSGGVSTHCLSSKTMAATRVPGLSFIGEAVDVTGWLGGYNFQWAWASAHACGSALEQAAA